MNKILSPLKFFAKVLPISFDGLVLSALGFSYVMVQFNNFDEYFGRNIFHILYSTDI